MPQHAQIYPTPRILYDAELLSNDGKTIDREWFTSQWTLVFLGFTWCPDICPTTLAELKAIYPQLQEMTNEEPVKILFLSVDPQRDNIERLNEYIHSFILTLLPQRQVTGAISICRSMGMVYSIVGSTDT